MIRLLLFTVILGMIAVAPAQSYRVDDSGGPLTLAEDLAAAAEAWNALVEDHKLEESGDAATVISFGDPERMGPDLVSLTLIDEGVEAFDVLLNPDLYRTHRTALLHELGLLLGLPVSAQGVLNPALEADGPTAPSDADIGALRELRNRVEGDIDGDGKVGLADLAALGRAYGQRGLNMAADLDGDGEVGAGDLEVLRSEYVFAAPADVAAEGQEPEAKETSPDDQDAGAGEPDGEAD